MASPVQRQARRNRAAAELAEFTGYLTAALEDPDVQKRIRSIAAQTFNPAVRRPATPTSAAAIRDIKRRGGTRG
jgi:hypothetical protein